MNWKSNIIIKYSIFYRIFLFVISFLSILLCIIWWISLMVISGSIWLYICIIFLNIVSIYSCFFTIYSFKAIPISLNEEHLILFDKIFISWNDLVPIKKWLNYRKGIIWNWWIHTLQFSLNNNLNSFTIKSKNQLQSKKWQSFIIITTWLKYNQDILYNLIADMPYMTKDKREEFIINNIHEWKK